VHASVWLIRARRFCTPQAVWVCRSRRRSLKRMIADVRERGITTLDGVLSSLKVSPCRPFRNGCHTRESAAVNAALTLLGDPTLGDGLTQFRARQPGNFCHYNVLCLEDDPPGAVRRAFQAA